MNRYRRMRYERGLTLDMLACESGVSKSTLMRLELDREYTPNATTAKRLADFYGVTVAEFLGVCDCGCERRAA